MVGLLSLQPNKDTPEWDQNFGRSLGPTNLRALRPCELCRNWEGLRGISKAYIHTHMQIRYKKIHLQGEHIYANKSFVLSIYKG